LSEKEINDWLVSNFAFISEGQYYRTLPTGDVFEGLDFQGLNMSDFFDVNVLKAGIRTKGGGRAANFMIDDSLAMKNGKITTKFVNVKGVGTQKIAEKKEKKENGFLSLFDAIKEFCVQKLIQRIAEKEKTEWDTVQTYAIIDIGLKYKENIVNPATSFLGDLLGLTIRQGTSRYVSSPNESAFYSVVPVDQLEAVPIGKSILQTLRSYGITSEQVPSDYLTKFPKTQVLGLEYSGGWNIQSDASYMKLIDFSQFFVLPHSKLNPFWRFSEKGMKKGFKLGAIIDRAIALPDPDFMQFCLETSDPEKAKEMMIPEREALKKEMFELMGDSTFVGKNKSNFLGRGSSRLMTALFRSGSPSNESFCKLKSDLYYSF